ncbi:MAG: Hpt domain-containing protein [Nitrosomonas sp.]|nr:Hpt domain-containing protein [Nitrosomonas sp.]MDP1951045.1 Hpt domain-containing protein [Nitrosomonas sp.]
MNAKAKLKITSVIGVKDGIDQIFSLINEYLESYAQNTDQVAQIESCRNYVHQLNGLLEMLELTGITLVSQQMEKLMEALAHQRNQPEPIVVNMLRQASHALSGYLNELIEGAEDNSLRLFPTYRDLMQAQGAKNVSESDLFIFHRASEPALPVALSHLDAAEMKASARQIRAEYQTGLLRWLRDTTSKDDLQQMANAISQIEKFPGSIEQRSFWWVCTGFMDGLLNQESTVDLSVRRLCGKIEQEIRHLAEGTPPTTERLIREVLYQVANNDSVSERIKEIHRAYVWPGQRALLDHQTNRQLAAEEAAQSVITASKQNDSHWPDMPDSAEIENATQEVEPAIEPVVTPIDPELISIFLEEADEVLAEMIGSLQRCQHDLTHIESLTTLRRCFHILKDCGRMVKLQALSEVAGNMEQVMAHWLNEQKPITQELIDVITHAHHAFYVWCDYLRQDGTTEVNADELLFLVNQLIRDRSSQAEAEVTVETTVAISDQDPDPTTSLNNELIPQPIPPEPIRAYDTCDEINPALWPLFLEEAQALTPEIASKLRAWCILPQDSNIPKALLSASHTLKDSARRAGAVHLSERIEEMESGIECVLCESIIPVPMIERLAIDFDEINERIDCLQNLRPAEVPMTQAEPVATATDVETSSSLPPAETAPAPEATTEQEIELPAQESVLCVNAELIDRLVNEFGEMSIVRSRVEAQLYHFKQSLRELNDSVDRLRGQLHEVENQAETQRQPHFAQTPENDPAFDPSALDHLTRFQELTRLMAESMDDIVTVQRSLRVSHRAAEEALTQQAQMNHQLQQELMRISALPFGKAR